MLDVVSKLRTVLAANAAVAAIVADRVRPWPANQTLALPCVLLTLVSATRMPTMQGSPTFDQFRVQIDCLGRTHAERAQLADVVRSALMDYSDADIQRVFFAGISDRTDDRAGNYGAMLEFLVHAAT